MYTIEEKSVGPVGDFMETTEGDIWLLMEEIWRENHFKCKKTVNTGIDLDKLPTSTDAPSTGAHWC